MRVCCWWREAMRRLELSADVASTMSRGEAELLHAPTNPRRRPLQIRLGRSRRSGIEELSNINVPTASGGIILRLEAGSLERRFSRGRREKLDEGSGRFGRLAGLEHDGGVRNRILQSFR